MRQTILGFDDGAVSHSLVKVKVEELDEWDATHDPAGKLLTSSSVSEDFEPDGEDEIKV
jgi:hypothetical protein